MLVALECAHAISILRRAIAIGKDSSRLGILSRGPPLSLFDMLLAIGGGSLCGSPFYVVLLSSSMWVLPFCSFCLLLFRGVLVYL